MVSMPKSSSAPSPSSSLPDHRVGRADRPPPRSPTSLVRTTLPLAGQLPCRAASMPSPGPLAASLPLLLLLLLFLQAATALGPTHNCARAVGSFINLDGRAPKGATVSNIELRSASLRKGLALWIPGEPLDIIYQQYSGRIVFQEKSSEFWIHNLTLADGGVYEIWLETTGDVTELLQTYTVFVFNISVTASRLANGSCSVNLRCEAGTGSRGVTYTWKRTATGATVSRDSWFHLLMGPNDEEDSYTCTAQDLGTQGALDVKPYKHCGDPSGAEGRFGFGLLPSGLLGLLLTLLVLL